jgi:hypothetical protein
MERRARTNPAQLHGLESKKKSTYRRGVFLDFPFYRTYQDSWEMVSTFTCEELGHNGINHARCNKDGVIGGDN